MRPKYRAEISEFEEEGIKYLISLETSNKETLDFYGGANIETQPVKTGEVVEDILISMLKSHESNYFGIDFKIENPQKGNLNRFRTNHLSRIIKKHNKKVSNLYKNAT